MEAIQKACQHADPVTSRNESVTFSAASLRKAYQHAGPVTVRRIMDLAETG